NRRVRSVGELLENQFRAGLVRMERLIKEKMTLHDIDAEDRLVPHKLVSPKSLSSVIKEFFGRSQLSQFMDQTNPLAELAHKRRLSALGPGGLSRERAGFEVRDIHPSHYGRICPIQTPEGPNIGLISYLSAYARVNEYGFVETPYCKVENGRVTDKIDYLAADEETECVIAQANASVDSKGKFVNDGVLARCKGEFGTIEASKVDYMDVSPKQLISIAAGLIPFLEHDDANRALMGSNMQRQAVPLLSTDQPLVATGLESKSAKDSGVLVVAEESGVITYVDATEIYIGNKVYYLRKYLRSNAGTCFNQKPIVKKGDKVVKGQVIADGPGTRGGELALGRNVLCAFMPWGGYNFEDAILISEKIVKEDIYTSIHIEEFDVSARETKIGKEEITRDIPNIGEEALKDLGEDGIVRIGAEVRAGNILVGKITPKSETELLPEEKLLRAIFGEKAADVRDTSLRIPSGTEGIVMDVKVFSRKERPRTDAQKKEERRLVKAISNNKAEKISQVNKGKSEELNNLLLGKTIKSDVVNINTGEVIIQAGKKIVKNHVNKLEDLNYSELDITEEDVKIRSQIKKLLAKYDYLIEKFETEEERELERLKKGDELEPGVIKQVKVYIASKRKLEVGDKMAGRHGNKG
ncbi:MAG: DNA-directed RNA polymerase subunit beta, partial [Candidatus Aureabacteria bacterium]|nr:DNA-directed RNA polymerase subunit beta [Candidatus Auribacterota bacterium]